MHPKVKASVLLYLLVAVLSAFIIGIGLYSVRVMKEMSGNSAQLYQDRILPLNQLSEIRYALSQEILGTIENLENGELTSGQAVRKIGEAQEKINQNWTAYLGTKFYPEEKKMADEAGILLSKTTLALNQMKEKLNAGETSVPIDLLAKETDDAIQPLRQKLLELSRLQISISKDLNDYNLATYRSTEQKFILVIAASLLFGALLAFLIINDNRKLIHRLITSNQQAREADEKYKYLFQNSPGSLVIWDLETLKVLEVNEEVIQKYGYSRREWEQMTILDYRPQEEWQRVKDFARDFQHSPAAIEKNRWRHVKKNGEEMLMEIASHRIMYNDRPAVLALAVDVTQQYKADQAIRESEEKYRYLFQNNPSYIILWDLEDLQVKEVNSAIIEKYGYSAEEWKNMSVLQYRPQEDHERIRDFARKMLRSDEPISKNIWRHLKKNGEEMLMEISSHKILYNNRPAILSLANDVTEQIRATAALQESRLQMHLFIEHSPAALAMFDTNMHYIITSKRWIRDYHLEGREVIGKSHYEVFPEIPERWKEIHQRCLQGAVEKCEEDTFPRLDGSTDWVRWEVRPWFKANREIGGIIMLTEVITDRKLAQINLLASEDRHRSLIENSSDAILLVNEHAKITYQSPSAERISGHSFEAAKDKTIFEFIHPDDMQKCLQFFLTCQQDPGVPKQNQFRILHSDGHYLWIEGTMTNLLDNPSVNAYIINYRDITERKQFETQQQLMSAIVDYSDDAIISKTLDGRLTSWNKGAEKILGFTAAEMIGQSISSIIPEALQDEEKAILSNIRAGRSIDHYQTRRRRKDGSLIYVSLTISPLRDETGRIIGASKILRDISEQKSIEEIIRQSEANYRQLFTLSPAPMWLIDQESKQFIQVNKAAVQNYGYTESEFAAMKLDDILEAESFTTGTQHVKKSGEVIEVETSSIPVMINGKRQVMMIAIDITEKSRYEQKLTRAAIKAQEEERYEIGGELHDNVCQILATSMIFLGMIKKSIPEESQDFYDHTHKYINLATTEIRNLSHRLAPAFFDKATLEDAFRQLLETINAANQYEIRLHFNECASTYPMIREQQLNLYRILQEQVRNISKYAKASVIEVEVLIVNHHLRMRIADNGVGFDLGRTSGGIGFANMNRRVQLYNGKLRIEAAVGKGCAVMVEMPVQQSHLNPETV